MNKEVIDYIKTAKLKGDIDFLVKITTLTVVVVTSIMVFLLSRYGDTEASIVSGIVIGLSIGTLGSALELREKNIVV